MVAEDAKGRSLMEYARDRRRDGCEVCSLPDEIRTQMMGASDKKIRRPIVLAWLRDEHNIEIGDAAMTAHVNGHHDASAL